MFQKILYSLNNISIIYNMIQKYRYTSLHYLIKRFTILSFLYKENINNNSLKIQCNIHVKAASLWMRCGMMNTTNTH